MTDGPNGLEGGLNPRWVVATLLITVTVIVTAWYFPILPQKIPTHFDMAGRPDGYAGKNAAWLPVMVQLLLTGLMKVSYMLLERPDKPWGYNFFSPRFLRSPKARMALKPQITAMLDGLLYSMLSLFLVLQYESLLVAAGEKETLSNLFLVPMAFIFGWSVYWLVVLYKRSRKLD